MSGVAKGIGKVFKKVVKVVKKIAPIVLAVGAIALTAGAGAGALGAAGASAAGAGTAAAGTAAAASTAGGGGFLSSFMSSIGVGGAGTAAAGVGAAGAASSVTGSLLGKVFSSPLLGKALAGAAAGYGQAKSLEAANQFEIDAEVRRQNTYAGTGLASNFDLAGATQGFTPIGLGGNKPQSPVAGPQDEAQMRVDNAQPPMQGLKTSYKPPRSPVIANVNGQQEATPKYRYNPETKRIDYA